ncbi:hypothetical protein CDD82_4705 [Ophiocordyceps australis]|uniref:Uncharacterized protein n=1 Tax=Ophiocordyceps australis TaxID=1399860 RepID=A0A2C5Z578_9HYPO|nr:hypothetical protein CDD82_4705 [Ophiocordyceps australis]
MQSDMALRQPDFPTAARAMKVVADQLEMCVNLPAVDHGARLEAMFQVIIDRLGALERRMDTMESKMNTMESKMDTMERKIDTMESKIDTMERKIDIMDTKIDHLSHRMTATERNGFARMENSTSMRLESTLVPLYGFESGMEIPGCPGTVEEADRLPIHDVDRILRQLNSPTTGSVAERRRRFLLTFGVTRRAL